jgi:tRNA-specific 2-thiouridylase
VGHLTKAQVRALAAAASSPLKDCRVISKRESMGLCFIGKRSFDSFLGRYIPITPGRLVNIDDMQEIPVRAGGDGPHCPEHYRVLGKHAGMEILTLGQGAGVSGAKSRWDR